MQYASRWDGVCTKCGTKQMIDENDIIDLGTGKYNCTFGKCDGELEFLKQRDDE